MLSQDGSSKMTSCKARISDEADATPLRDVPFLILWHHTDTVRIGFCQDRSSAQAFYDSNEAWWSKVILDRSQSEVRTLRPPDIDYPHTNDRWKQPRDLIVHVGTNHDPVRQCKACVKRSGFPATLDTCTYVVGSSGRKDEDPVSMAGFMDEQSAEAFYDLVPKDFPKILKYRSTSQVS